MAIRRWSVFAATGLICLAGSAVFFEVRRSFSEDTAGTSLSQPKYREPEGHNHQERDGSATYVDVNVPAITSAQVSAVFASGGFLHRNGGRPGTISEVKVFPNMEALKIASVPSGCSMIRAEGQDGKVHVWTMRCGWERASSI